MLVTMFQVHTDKQHISQSPSVMTNLFLLIPKLHLRCWTQHVQLQQLGVRLPTPKNQLYDHNTQRTPNNDMQDNKY